MGKVCTNMTMSLDGFIAGPDDNPAELFDWYGAGDVSVPSANENTSFNVDEGSAEALDRGHLLLEDPVVIQGRRALHLRYPVRR